jgi:two-component sensor histidine kinase
MALSLMMILHELAANAAKHGAFAHEGGTLSVRWQKVALEQNEALQLKWQEFGVSCNIQPERSGYGFTLIDATTKSLAAKVERLFLGDGISMGLIIPLR